MNNLCHNFKIIYTWLINHRPLIYHLLHLFEKTIADKHNIKYTTHCFNGKNTSFSMKFTLFQSSFYSWICFGRLSWRFIWCEIIAASRKERRNCSWVYPAMINSRYTHTNYSSVLSQLAAAVKGIFLDGWLGVGIGVGLRGWLVDWVNSSQPAELVFGLA